MYKINEVVAIENYINKFRDNFHKAVSKKTGWGKEELKATLEVALSQSFIDVIKEA